MKISPVREQKARYLIGRLNRLEKIVSNEYEKRGITSRWLRAQRHVDKYHAKLGILAHCWLEDAL